jgi:hypothetical protein
VLSLEVPGRVSLLKTPNTPPKLSPYRIIGKSAPFGGEQTDSNLRSRASHTTSARREKAAQVTTRPCGLPVAQLFLLSLLGFEVALRVECAPCSARTPYLRAFSSPVASHMLCDLGMGGFHVSFPAGLLARDTGRGVR